ncbi:MAG: cytochrome c [Roseibium sp.]|nr:cytochrome c [Roseibium sp.]
MKRKLGLICAAAIAVGTFAGPVFANDSFDGAIKARKALMTLYAFNLGQLGAMAKGEVEYNADQAQAAANNLKDLAAVNLGAAWPQGSDSTALPGKTRAKVEAWSNYPESAKIHGDLVAASTAMAASAGDGVDGIRKNIGAIGATCTACHKAFREPQ